MPKLAAQAAAPLDLTVRFIGSGPIEEVVYWVRRCAERQRAEGPLMVVLQAKRSRRRRPEQIYEVRLERADGVLLTEQDSNIMLAVRNAFERFGAFCRGLGPRDERLTES